MRIYKYLFREVVGLQVVITGLLLFVFISTRVTQRLFDVGDGMITPALAMVSIFYRIPYFLTEVMPAAFMLAIMLGLSRLYADNEITALQACGLSQKRLYGAIMIPAGLSAIILALLTIWWSPNAMIAGNDAYDQMRRQATGDLIQPGAFRTIGSSGSTIYATAKEDETLQSLVLIRREGDNLTVLTGEQGQVDMRGYADYLRLMNATQTEFTPTGTAFSQFDEQSLLIAEHSERVGNHFRELSTGYIIANRDSGLSLGWTAKLFWRFHYPLIMLVIPLFAIPLSKANQRSGSYAKIIPAVVIYMVYTTLLSYFHRELGEISIWLTLGWPHLLVAVLALTPAVVRHWRQR